jgi:hypothetical protein
VAGSLDVDEVLEEGVQHLVRVDQGDYRPFSWGRKKFFRLRRKVKVDIVMLGEVPRIPLVLLLMTGTGEHEGAWTELMGNAVIGPPYPTLENADKLMTDGVPGT